MNLDGNLTRNEDRITISLDQTVDNCKLYYRNDPTSEFTFLEEFKNTNKITFEDPHKNNRTFYLLKCDNFNPFYIAERVLPLKNFSNFRDIGGYKTKDNRTVKYGYFYRSEDLSKLKDADLDYFKTLGLKTVIDYRADEEEEANPDVRVDGIKYYLTPGVSNSDNNLDMISRIKDFLQNKCDMNPKAILIDGYKAMPLNNKAYENLINLIRQPSNTPLLQHCTAGKDRTGFGSALILLLLGVPKDTVINDYLLTNKLREHFNNALFSKYGSALKDLNISDQMITSLKEIMGVSKDFIEESFNVILSKYNSFEDYFKGEFKLTDSDIENIRNTYLY